MARRGALATVARHSEPAPSRPLRGAGSSKSKGAASVQTAPDTLFSTAVVSAIDLLGEGELEVIGGLAGTTFNGTLVQDAASGNLNFQGISAEYRTGTPDQAPLDGQTDVEGTSEVGIEVRQFVPVVQTISAENADRARVIIQIPALLIQGSDGSTRFNVLDYRLEVRYSGGPWTNPLGDLQIYGKNTSPYYRQHELDLPKAPVGTSAPWNIRLTRLTPDADGFNNSQNKFTNQSDLIFYSLTTITDARFSYPGSALVGWKALASLFGSSEPQRRYLVRRLNVPVPVNYDPVARTYAGIWDGTFKEAYTDNPAWAFWLLLSDKRFGLGRHVDVSAIDKWALYNVARYCDEMVPDGRGGMEPRFTFNGTVYDQQDASDVLQLVCQIFRGMMYYSAGAITVTQDRPADVKALVTEANTVDDPDAEDESPGPISYASSSRSARKTRAFVTWSDPDNFDEPLIEVVPDDEGIARYGVQDTKIDALGCRSRGQAQRLGRLMLASDLREKQLATYAAGLDHAVRVPGDIVAIQDPQIADLDWSGRLLAGSTATVLRLDRLVDLSAASDTTVTVTLPDGSIAESAFSEAPVDGRSVLTLTSPLPADPDPAAVWVIAGNVQPQLFRIVSITESEPHIFKVSALQHEPSKFGYGDDVAPFEETPISLFPTVVAAPTNLTVREAQYLELGVPHQALTLSWTAGNAFNSVGYVVTALMPSGAVVNLPERATTSADFTDAETGEWTFIVVAKGLSGQFSAPSKLVYVAQGWAGTDAPVVTNLRVTETNGTTFLGRSCTVTWSHSFPDGRDPYPVENVVTVLDAASGALVHSQRLTAGQTDWTYAYDVNVSEGGPRRTFRVTVGALTPDGRESGDASIVVTNPAPGVPAYTIQTLPETLFVLIEPPTDADLSGYLVWASQTSGFTPATPTVIADGPGTSVVQKLQAGTWYVRIAAYDGFGKTGLNISGESAVTIGLGATPDYAQTPALPGALSYSTSLARLADGTMRTSVVLDWPANADGLTASYALEIREGSGNWIQRYAGVDPHAEVFGLLPGASFQARVRAISRFGAPSAGYSPILSGMVASNTTPPGPATGLSAEAAFQTVTLSWTNPADPDLDVVEVWAASVANMASAAKIGEVDGNRFWHTGLAPNTTRYYWVRPRNSSGLPAATFAPDTVGGLAATTAYVAGVDIGLEQVQSANLAAQIVGERELALGAVTISRLGVGLGNNLAYNSDFLAGSSGAQYAMYPPSGGSFSYVSDHSPDWNYPGDKFGLIYHPGAWSGIVDFYMTFPQLDGTFSRFFPVTPGKTYEASAYLSMFGASAQVCLTFYDANFNYITETDSSSVFQGSNKLGDEAYRRGVIAGVPPNAAYASPVVRKFTSGANDQSWMFFTKLYFGQTVPNATQLSPWSPASGTIVDGSGVRANSIYGVSIRAGEINANHVTTGELITTSAQIRNEIVDDAKITNLNAAKLIAGTVIPGSVLMGASFGSYTNEQILDVLTRLPDYLNVGYGIGGTNRSGSTLIQPGIVRISGSTTLDDWRDTTFMKGGALKNNSVLTTKLTVNSRSFYTQGIDFSADKGSRTVSWTAGYLFFTDNDGGLQAPYLAAGSAASGGYIYIFFDYGDWSALHATTDWPSVSGNPNYAVIATYDGYAGISVIYGGIITDGSRISAGTMETVAFRANSIDGSILRVNSASVSVLAAGTIQTSGPIYLGGSTIELNPQAQAIITRYANGVETFRVDGGGLTIRGADNTVLLNTNTGVPAAKVAGATGSSNLLPNSDVTGGLTNLHFYSNGTLPLSSGTSLANFGGSWNPVGMDAAAIWMLPTAYDQYMDIHVGFVRSGGAASDDRIPAVGGAWYEASAYVGAHRCTAQVWVGMYDYQGNALSYGVWSGSGAIGGQFLSQFDRVGGVVQAPSGTEYIVFWVRGTSFTDGTQAAFVFATGFMLAPAVPNQAAITAYTPGPSKDQITPSTIGTYIQTLTVDTIYVKNGAISTVAAAEGVSERNLSAWTVMADTGDFVCKGGNVQISAAVNIYDGGEYGAAANTAVSSVRGFDVLLDGNVVGTMTVWDAVNGVTAAAPGVFNFYWGGQSVSAPYKVVVGAGSHRVQLRVRDGGNWKSRTSLTITELAK